MDNNYIDKAVREAVGDYEVDFATPDWEEMESRLDQDQALRRKLYLTKAVEVCLVLLAIWTIVPFLDTQAPHEAPSSPDEPAIAAPLQADDEPIAAQLPSTLPAALEALPSAPPQVGSAAVRTRTATPPVVPNDELALTANAVPLTAAAPQNDDEATVAVMSDAWTRRSVAVSISSHPDKEQLTRYSLPSRTATQRRYLAPIAYPHTIAAPLTPAVAMRRPSATKRSNSITPASRLSVGVMSSTEWLNIQEQHTIALSRKARRINPALGVVANFAVSEKLQLEGGLMAIQRQEVERRFEPMPYNRGIVGERKSIKTTAVELQTNVSYNFGQLGKTKLFAMAGLSNYLALMSDQRLMEKNLFASANFDASTVTNGTMGSGIPTTTQVEAHAGNKSSIPTEWAHRHQLSLNLGVSAEIPLSDKWTLFARMLYKNGLTTVGPFDDQVSALNMGAGVRTQL